MGKMNLLKGSWDGKVGKTVGAKWKDKATLRTYSKPSNPRTPAQMTVRDAFKDMTSFVALFADQIKYKTALPVAGMSVRNAIIKLNKDMISDGAFDAESLKISKGGLQTPVVTAVTIDSTSKKVTVTWTPPTATNFTENAKAICVCVSAATQMVDVFEEDVTAGTKEGSLGFGSADDVIAYVYFLDKRGSGKVASTSVATAAA